jgi:hypothetical protein
MRTRPVTLTCSAGSVTVRVPMPKPGFFSTIGLKSRGWIDRGRNYAVLDSQHTYSLHITEDRFNIHQLDAGKRMEQLRGALCLEAARADTLAKSTVPNVPAQPTLEDLAVLKGRDRQRWADEIRQCKAASFRAAEAQSTISAAQASSMVLQAELTQFDRECYLVMTEWAKAWRAWAGIYTRARFTGRRAAMSPNPNLPAYRPAHELTPTTATAGTTTEEN